MEVDALPHSPGKIRRCVYCSPEQEAGDSDGQVGLLQTPGVPFRGHFLEPPFAAAHSLLVFSLHVLRMMSWRSGGGVGRRDRSGGGGEYAGKRRRVGGEAVPETESQDVEVETTQQDRRAACDRWTSTRVRWREAEKHSEGPEEPGPEDGKRQTGRGSPGDSPFEAEYQIHL